MFYRFLTALFFALFLSAPVLADEPKPDDTVSFDLSAEDWVAAKTAHVTLNVEAAVSAANAGAMRADMIRSVNDAAKADWKVTGFNRAQDQTGMERWSAVFEARLPETDLNGLAESVKKASKAGMQITVGDIDFNPTLDEIETARAGLRAHIFKDAGEQLVALNASLPGRGYRIAQINFDAAPMPMFARPMNRVMMASAASALSPNDTASSPDHAQKIVLTAHVVFAALPQAAIANH
jgi:predicted secreted protein